MGKKVWYRWIPMIEYYKVTDLKFKIQAQFLIDRIQKTISRFEETDREWISFIHTRTGSELIEAKSDYSNFLLGQEGDRCHFRTLIERGRRAISSLEQALKDHLNCECNSAFSLPHQTDNASHHQPHHPIGEANVHTHTAHQASLNYGITALQLPRVKPPIFSGDPLQWPSFWATFEVMVHSKPISNAEKMSYLVMFLRNDAKRAINGYHITNDNYPIVIDLLKRRFGNEKVIAEINEMWQPTSLSQR
ncbi:gag protein [Ditylenchus destructor]|nr:gag protein [Ditylenchus destructor]